MFGTAALDRGHDLHLRVCDMAPAGTKPNGDVNTEFIRDLRRWTGHKCRRLPRLRGREQRELIERVRHNARNLARDMRIARRRVELGKSQSHLKLRMSVPCSRRCAAKLCLSVCGDTSSFSIPTVMAGTTG